jgi:hypothetical protein
MKDGNLSNKPARFVFVDAESLFYFKVIPVLKAGVNEKLRALLREFNVTLYLDKRSRRLRMDHMIDVISTDVFFDKRKNLPEMLKSLNAIFLVSIERTMEFQDIENVYPIELSVNAIKELV